MKAYREALDTYRFDLAANILYEFTRNQFCDWYLELTKPVVSNGSEAEQRGTRHTLITVLEALLRWRTDHSVHHRNHLAAREAADRHDRRHHHAAAVPGLRRRAGRRAGAERSGWIKQTIIAVRNIRAEMNIAPSKALDVLLRNCSADAQRRVQENQSFIARLARTESIALLPAGDKGPVSVTKLVDGAELLIPMAGFIDKDAEIARGERDGQAGCGNRFDRRQAGERRLRGARAGSGGRQRARSSGGLQRRQSEAAGTAGDHRRAVIHRLTPTPEKQRGLPRCFIAVASGPG